MTPMTLKGSQDVSNLDETESLRSHPVPVSDSDVSVPYRADDSKLISSSSEKSDSNGRGPDPIGWTPMLVLAGIICCFGSALPAGYNIGVMNNPRKILEKFCNETVEERYGVKLSPQTLTVLWSVIVSIFLVGGVTGSLGSSALADRLGRRGALIIGNICGIIGAIMFYLVPILNSLEFLLLGRLMVGFSGGLATSLVPTYMTETAPINLRGAVGVLCQLGITCGVLLGQIAGLDSILGTKDLWNYMLAAFAPLSGIAAILTLVLPESPKYLYVIKEDRENGLKALSLLRNTGINHLEGEIDGLEIELSSKCSSDTWTIATVLQDPTLRLPVLLVSCLQLGQQLSGVNALFFYSQLIFEKAKLDNKTSQYATLGTGLINILMAVISVKIMSLFRRRLLLFTSCLSTIACLVILCASIALIDLPGMEWVCIVAVQAFVLFYGIGLGPIPYFIGSELFDAGPRSSAMSIGSVCNWGGNFMVAMTFPLLNEIIKSYSFLVFAACLLFVVLFCRKYLPETHGRTTNEIAAEMSDRLRSRPNGTSAHLS
ncbi:hypothetical protein QAD02_019019 [Eretmocerus hayati]|uniref:Uncharacterized protein n=1 Tax=Eretmocerus hayati TaxID=131215 RepID=A0ACC2PIM9_9HYME|nr:hypothetical protein QAD02_019019 [Eretmocerus hayati]